MSAVPAGDRVAPERRPVSAKLKHAIIARTGLAYYADRDKALARKVADRMALLGLASQSEYLERLDGDSREWDALIDELTVGETYFFRYRAQFDALRDRVLPQCIESNRAERTLRIWCAGCASGAEPYSILMLIRDELPDIMAGWSIGVVATDINRRELRRGAAGEFSAWELRDMPEAYKLRHFENAGPRWCLRERFAGRIEFRAQNLVHEAEAFAREHASAFDIVFCRNVMIYFDVEVNRRILKALHAALAPNGWLFVGHAEPYLEIVNFFHPQPVPGAVLYRKQAVAAPLVPPPPRPAFEPPTQVPWPSPPLPPAPCGSDGAAPPGRHEVEAARASPELPAAERPEGLPAVRSALDEVRALANAAQWDAALALCAELLERDELDADVHYLRGLILGHRGDAAEAEAALGRAVYLDRAFALAYYHLGLAAASRGDRGTSARALHNSLRALRDADEAAPVRGGDGLTVAELRALTEMQLELPEARP